MNKEEWEKQNKERYSNPFRDIDDVMRQKETEMINSFIRYKTDKKILEVGCGDGYMLSILSMNHDRNKYWGIDYTEKMIEQATNRMKMNETDCHLFCDDVRTVDFPACFFDIIYSQRCLINLFNWEEQKKALDRIHTLLDFGGYYLLIEAFTDGLENNNKARTESGLPSLKPSIYNTYFDKEKFFKYIQDKFIVYEVPTIQHNFLSTHYFISRVLHALVTKGKQVTNTEFVKFYSTLPPTGNYSPVQVYLLKKVYGEDIDE